jgi:hypothetical protein
LAGGVEKDAAGWRMRAVEGLKIRQAGKKNAVSVDLFINDSDWAH